MVFGVPAAGVAKGGRAATQIVLVLVLWLVSLVPAGAETLRGVALVIGNGAYEHLPALNNPSKDARAMENLLTGLGFETTLAADRDARKLSRALDNFIEDVQGADVAVVYYAGHGIEAGGENFLVPIDADLAALEEAGQRLVAVSAFIQRLQAEVPLAIVMLDACRDNPFPPGSMVRLDATARAQSMSARGLGETRGVSAFSEVQKAESFGTVIAFAAEPGRTALDGYPGGNSPYAAALLRHLDAMAAGEEFSTVMRMVGEEVYLKTNRQQRPWVNESLRRLLYFGRAPAPADGEAGEILAERRQLLVTIAALPDAERRQVEKVAADGGVPLDAVYAVLRAMGSDIPDDPAKLEEKLLERTAKMADLFNRENTLTRSDDELARLAKLTNEALKEGAVEVARRLRHQVDSRIAQLAPTVESAEEQAKAKRLEFAREYVTSAEVAIAASDFLEAAGYYAKAADEVSRWDARLQWDYVSRELSVLTSHGNEKGDNVVLLRAIATGERALRLADGLSDRDAWAKAQHHLGIALQTLGERESGTERLEQAGEAYRAALQQRARERVPLDWASTQNNLGTVLAAIGARESGTVRLEQAATAYRAALEEHTRIRAPLKWAATQQNLGIVLMTLGSRENGTARLEQAIEAFSAALQENTRERVPLDWAMTLNNMGNALHTLGQREGGTARFEQAVETYRAALEERTRARVPLQWAATQNNLGNALWSLGERESGTGRLEQAAEAYRAALEERTRSRVPLDWALTMNNLGNVLQAIAGRERGTARLQDAVEAYNAALEERTRTRVPLDWAVTQNNLGNALSTLGQREGGTTRLQDAVGAYHAALEERTRERVPLQWAATQNNLGTVLRALGEREDGTARLQQAAEAFREALQEYTRARDPLRWAMTHNNLGNVLSIIGRREAGTVRLEQAVEAFHTALEVRTRASVPLDWASTQNNLGGTLVEIGKRTGRKAQIVEGRKAILASWDVHREAGYLQYDDYYKKRIADADALLAALK